jgi:hypothetical protein
LISKGAKAEIWFLTPQIKIDEGQPYLFDITIRYTSSNLREISLNTLEKCPQIIRHLADECPKLSMLKAPYGILEVSDTLIPDMARLVDQLTTLVLHGPDPDAYNDSHGVFLSKQLLVNFSTLFQLLQCPKSLTHLELPFTPSDSASIQAVRPALSRLVNLTFIYIPIDSNVPESPLIFSECRSLQHVEMHDFGRFYHQNSDVFVPAVLRALSESPIGDRIFVRSVFRSLQSFFDNVLLGKRTSLPCLLSYITDSGFVGPLSGNIAAGLMAISDVNDAMRFVDELESESRPRWMPHLRDVTPHLLSFWIKLVSNHPLSVVKNMVSRLGSPKDKHWRLIAVAVAADKFDTLQYFVELGMMTRENLMATEPRSIFSYVVSVAMFHYLVGLLSREDAHALLLHSSGGYESAFFNIYDSRQNRTIRRVFGVGFDLAAHHQ